MKAKIKYDVANSSQPVNSAGCLCQSCGRNYKFDLIIEDDLWEQIKPKDKDIGSGLLCPLCIIDRIETAHGFACYHLLSKQLIDELQLLRKIANEAKKVWDKGIFTAEESKLKNLLTDRIHLENIKEEMKS